MRFVHTGTWILILASSLAGCGGGGPAKDPCLVDCENRNSICGASPDAGAGGISCAQFCDAVRSSNPAQCSDEIDAFFQCAVDKETYSCPKGVVTVTPTGGCALEGATCSQCTGKAACYLSF